MVGSQADAACREMKGFTQNDLMNAKPRRRQEKDAPRKQKEMIPGFPWRVSPWRLRGLAFNHFASSSKRSTQAIDLQLSSIARSGRRDLPQTSPASIGDLRSSWRAA